MQGWYLFNESTRVCKYVMADMCKCHIAHTEGVISSKDGQGVTDMVSAGVECQDCTGNAKGTDPSTPSKEAILLDFMADFMSAEDVAIWNVWRDIEMSRTMVQ